MTAAFQNQVIVVTGASRGIGAAAALAFARDGAHVVVNYRGDASGAQRSLAAIQASGGRATVLQADVSQPDAVAEMVERVESDIGPIQVLVNNAAAFDRSAFLDVSLEDFDRVWNTNVRGLYYLSQCAARHMATRQSGCIVHVSSILAQLAVPTRTVYCAAKGAIESLTRAMALDLAAYGIRVVAVAPGLIETEAMLAGFADPARLASVQSYIPHGRFGAADEVASVIVFLASGAARYINGSVIAVDGALGAREAGPLPANGRPPR
jgi:glucose 1-dehydrogenase